VKRQDNASITKEIITSSHNKTSNKTFVTSVLFQDTNRNYQTEWGTAVVFTPPRHHIRLQVNQKLPRICFSPYIS